MRKLLLSLIAVFVAVAVTAPTAAAVTYGEPDAGEHPYVGFMIYFDPAEPGWFSCSGTLLDADTFLTAAHCAYGVGTDGAVTVDADGQPTTTGGTDVWVTFDEDDALAGWPPRTEDITEQELYDDRSAWLDANPDFYEGTAIPHPDYDNFADFPITYDVGVVQLTELVPAGETCTETSVCYGELAPIGTAETLAGTPRDRNTALVESVGYGIQSIQPHPQDETSRYKSTSRIAELNGNQSEGGNLHTLNNPSKVGGRGGTCFGDSGGPVFVNDTNEVISVVSYGPSATCHGADYSWRVDTADSYDFIDEFVSLM